MFGEDEDGGDELDAAEKSGENGLFCPIFIFQKLNTLIPAQEIATLRKEAQAFTAVRKSLRTSPSMNGTISNGEGSSKKAVDAARLAFDKVGYYGSYVFTKCLAILPPTLLSPRFLTLTSETY